MRIFNLFAIYFTFILALHVTVYYSYFINNAGDKQMITFNSDYADLQVHTEYNFDNTVFYVVYSGVKLVVAKSGNE